MVAGLWIWGTGRECGEHFQGPCLRDYMMPLGMPSLFILFCFPHFPRWVIYNDQKVCASEKPPKDLGYIYFYQRVAS